MAKSRILQHTVIAFCIAVVLLFFGWICSHQPNMHEVLFGKGFWYYTLLRYIHISPFVSNIFSVSILLFGTAIAAGAVSRLTYNWIGSPIIGVLYACNPWMLHMTESRSEYLFALFGIPLLFACAYSLTKHRLVLFATTAVLGFMTLIAPTAVLGSAVIILCANLLERKWWSGFIYSVLASSAVAGIVLHIMFFDEPPNSDAFVHTIASSFDLSRLNSVFPHNTLLQHLFTLGTVGNDITPNVLAGLLIICVVLLIVFYRKLNYAHMVYLGSAAIAGIFALGPVLLVSGEIRPNIILPYAVFAQVFPHLEHSPAVLICIFGFTLLVFLALVLQTIYTTNKTAARSIGIACLIVLGAQVIPLPFPVSSRVHFVGYTNIQNTMAVDGRILEFHQEEETLFAPYSAQRYMDSGIEPISASSQTGKVILAWLQNSIPFIPQNSSTVYTSLLRDYFHIDAIDQITCVPGLLGTQPRFTPAEDVSLLPITTTLVHADKCHTLSAVDAHTAPIEGILSPTTANDGVSRLYPSHDNPQSIKFVDDAKLTYLNTTDNDQTITVTITGATAEPLHAGIAADSEFVYNEFLDHPQEFAITFSFPANPNSSVVLDFVLKDAENMRITKNKKDAGLQIERISYSIADIAHY